MVPWVLVSISIFHTINTEVFGIWYPSISQVFPFLYCWHSGSIIVFILIVPVSCGSWLIHVCLYFFSFAMRILRILGSEKATGRTYYLILRTWSICLLGPYLLGVSLRRNRAGQWSVHLCAPVYSVSYTYVPIWCAYTLSTPSLCCAGRLGRRGAVPWGSLQKIKKSMVLIIMYEIIGCLYSMDRLLGGVVIRLYTTAWKISGSRPPSMCHFFWRKGRATPSSSKALCESKQDVRRKLTSEMRVGPNPW